MNIFSFHITKDKIVLRFYPNSVRVTEGGEPLEAWEFIELNLFDK